MTILQIEYFIEIVKSGSFTKAAEKLYVTHQALSLQIQALEKELGMPLFDRSNRRKLILEESGKILYEAWVPLLEAHRNAVRLAKEQHEGQKKILRVGIHNTPRIRDVSVSLISELTKQNDLEPEFIVGEPEALLNKLEAGELDMCSMISFALYGKENLKYKDIGDKKAVPMIVVSKENPLSKKKKVSVWDIRDEVIITFDENYARGATERIREMMQREGIEDYKMKVLKNIQEVKIALCLNQGVTIELDLAMQDILDKVKMFPIPHMDEKDMAKIVLVWKDEKWNNMIM